MVHQIQLTLFSRPKRQGQLSKERIEEMLNLLRKLIIVKTHGRAWSRQITVKSRDLGKIGIFDHKTWIDFGKLLRLLVNVGLAYKANGCRPIRYVLKEPMIYWAYFCNKQCSNDSSICGLYGQCPYHRLLSGVKNGFDS